MRIMDLALQLNESSTLKARTGTKPTVFVDFSGHVCKMGVRIYANGWDCESYDDAQFNIYMDTDTEENLAKAIKCIELLERLVWIWSVNQRRECEDSGGAQNADHL